MADFVAVLKKTLDGLGETTPQIREKVYGKARATIDAKLASLNPPPPAAVAERQKRSLEEAIATVEDEYASIAASQPSKPDDLDDVFASMAHPGDIGRPSVEKQAQALADPGLNEERDPFSGGGEDLGMRAVPLPPRPRRRWAGRLAAAVVALAVLTGAAYGIWLNRDEFSAMLGVDVSRLFASNAKPGSGDPVDQAIAATKKPVETKAEARKRREAEKAAAAKVAIVAEAPSAEAPVSAPAAAALPAEATPAAAVAATPVKFTQRLSPDGTEVDAGPAGGATTVGEGSSTATSTLPAPTPEPPATVADVLVAQAEPVAPPASADPAVPEAPAEPVPTPPEAAAAASAAPPADPIVAAADPAVPAQPGAQPVEASPGEGAPPPEAALPAEAVPAPEAAPAAEGGAAEATAPAGAVAPATTPGPTVATAATASPASVAVGQKAIFYEERTTAESGSAETGGIVWSLVQESPGGDLPAEPAIRAEATIPGKDLQLRMTIKRNGDQTLPASHIVELIFLTPEGFEGGGIDNVLRIALKTSEEEAGAPLLGVPAKIADGFFLFALNDSKPDVDANSALLNGRNWIDVPILYKSGRRALFTMEKGIPGEKVFQEAMKSWAAAKSG